MGPEQELAGSQSSRTATEHPASHAGGLHLGPHTWVHGCIRTKMRLLPSFPLFCPPVHSTPAPPPKSQGRRDGVEMGVKTTSSEGG